MPIAFRHAVALLALTALAFLARPGPPEISVGVLTKEQAEEKYGITMHARPNGDAGIQVWLAFRREGMLEKFTYAELRMQDPRGEHQLSARLQPNPIRHGQPQDVTTVAFSADPGELARCSFLVVCYGSSEGDVGYYLKVKDFLDLANPVTEDRAGSPVQGSQGAEGSSQRGGGTRPMQIEYLEIVTPDVDGVCAAYAKANGVTFGEPVAALGNARTAPLAPGGRVGVRAPMAASEEPVTRPYFLVQDIQAAVDAAVAAGAEVAHPPMEIPGEGTFAIFFQGGVQHALWQR